MSLRAEPRALVSPGPFVIGYKRGNRISRTASSAPTLPPYNFDFREEESVEEGTEQTSRSPHHSSWIPHRPQLPYFPRPEDDPSLSQAIQVRCSIIEEDLERNLRETL